MFLSLSLFCFSKKLTRASHTSFHKQASRSDLQSPYAHTMAVFFSPSARATDQRAQGTVKALADPRQTHASPFFPPPKKACFSPPFHSSIYREDTPERSSPLHTETLQLCARSPNMTRLPLVCRRARRNIQLWAALTHLRTTHHSASLAPVEPRHPLFPPDPLDG
jgi:hypothetical protein